MKLRRIIYVLKIFPKVSETFIATELAELLRRGIEARILSLEPPRAAIRHGIVASAGLDQITSYDPARFPEIVKQFDPQLLHAHFATEATATAIDLATEQGVPLTFTTHGYDIYRKAPADLRARAAAARAVVTVSRANATFMEQRFGVPASHIRVIPCGVDVSLFRTPNGALPDPEPPLIVCVARYVAVKNLSLLLESCAILQGRGVRFRCIIIGDGPCRVELEKTREQLGLQRLIEMPGSAEQSDVLDCWQRASVGVLTSDNEGMPVSLMEAAACGVPAVATKVGGVPELVEDGVTGLLVPPGDARALAAALERVIGDPALRTRMSRAARKRAEEKFSVRSQVDQLLALWSEILRAGGATPVFVSDPFDAIADPEMPTLKLALDSSQAKQEFKHRLPRLSGEDGHLRLKAIRVIRHKPARRCVVEYDLRVHRPERPPEKVTILGKVRARRFGKEGYRVLERMWNAGFDSNSEDLISVPQPIGIIPRFQMWFQSKVPGETATRLLGETNGIELAQRIACAIHKLHQANVPTERRHNMGDELRILHECLAKVATRSPEWSTRLGRVLSACDRLGATVLAPKVCGIHRDFYPAQVMVSGDRIYLIDFDLYCLGDPGLDIGNFIGHITEQSLRETGDPRRRASQEQAFKEAFVALSGESYRPSIEAYTTLTLVRHIYLSTQFPNRQVFTLPLLKLCEQRLGLS